MSNLIETVSSLPEFEASQIKSLDEMCTAYNLPTFTQLLRDKEFRSREHIDKLKNLDRARDQASCQMESISSMVAALTCDFDRLEELQDELKDAQSTLDDAIGEVDTAEQALNDCETNPECEDCTLAQCQDAFNDACETMLDAENDLYSLINDQEELQDLINAAWECSSNDNASDRIQEHPLSVEIRSEWVTPGEEMEACEFTILLCTGGPACRIIGTLDQYKQPDSARLQYQDWFTPWCDYYGDNFSESDLLTYSQQFYFGY